MSVQSFAKLMATGRALPKECVTNQALAARLAERGIETSHEWIVERTGITQRYLASGDESTTSLGLAAAKQALERAGLAPEQLDLIIVATSTPDQVFPSAACLIQSALGAKRAAAFDVQAACSGFVYALTTANSFIRSGQAQHVLIIGAEVFSRLLDWDDRRTCVLFGDGAGAVVLSRSDEPGILSCSIHADGGLSSILEVPGRLQNGQACGHPTLLMDGQAVFKQAVSVLSKVGSVCLDQAGLDISQLDWFIPHQANVRILQATAKKMGIDLSRVVMTADLHGNTSAASVPLALDVAVCDGRIQRGQHVLLQGVGGGFTWGGVLLRY